ncbi:hypothetical protein GX48_05607 [Paracoccidioides brasiliensis]|nr:hypothetical protein GX48_05607 [Paracoccidioides brasiliensis]
MEMKLLEHPTLRSSHGDYNRDDSFGCQSHIERDVREGIALGKNPHTHCSKSADTRFMAKQTRFQPTVLDPTG